MRHIVSVFFLVGSACNLSHGVTDTDAGRGPDARVEMGADGGARADSGSTASDAGPACMGGDLGTCGPGMVCTAASCSEWGSCGSIPRGCRGNFDPVCGFDGRTYVSRCNAEVAGQVVAYSGECGSSCAAQDVRITEGCDAVLITWDGTSCRQQSGCCTGTDCGDIYSSLEACRNVHRSCPRPCGGWVGPTCLADEFCDFEGDGCDWADNSGVCRARPTECPDPGGSPVCGCNFGEYHSECAAHLAGTDVGRTGTCDVDG